MEGEPALAVSSTSVAQTPASCCSVDDLAGGGKSSSSMAGVSADAFEVKRPQILRELQGAVDRYNDCFRSLRIALDDVELLRQENLALRVENLELSLLLEEEREEEVMAAAPDGRGVLGARAAIGRIGAGKENVPPAGGIGGGKGETGTHDLVPKSISIRSKGFLAAKDSAAGGGGASPEDVGGSSDAFSRPYRPLPLAPAQVGEETDGTGTAVEVYNQGMAKTELCNKWEELGWCPYGDLCQFAHGVDELRPVIRHPRYKTQLCRMINVPGGCPYGHRCHFRHALLP